MGCGITLDAERSVRAPASRVRTDLARALRDAGFKLGRETTMLLEGRRGSQLASAVSLEKLPMTVTLRLAPTAEACGVSVHLEDTWRSPINKVYGLNGKYDRVFQAVLERVDAELARVDPAAAAGFGPAVTVSPMGQVALLERANQAYGDAAQAATGAVDRKLGAQAAEPAPPPEWKGVQRLRLVDAEEPIELGISEAAAVLGVAALIGAQPGTMPEPLVREIESLAVRVETALESGAQLPEVPLGGSERSAIDFLRQQAAEREALPVRRLLVCRDCRFEKIVNEDYRRLMERNRKLGALVGGVGATIGRGGISPFVLVGSLFRMKKLDPDFVCPRCQGMTADPYIVTFCPQCGQRQQDGALRTCKCGFDFRRDGAKRLAARIAEEQVPKPPAPPALPPAPVAPPAEAAAPPPPPPPPPPPRVDGPLTLTLSADGDDAPERTIPIEGALVVGRDSEADVVVDDPRVSRRHMRLTPREDGVVLEDLGSSNGTTVNGHRITEPVLLTGGETVHLGGHVAHVVAAVSDPAATVTGDVPAG